MRHNLAILAALLLGAQSIGPIEVHSDDQRVLRGVAELYAQFTNLMLDPELPRDQVSIMVVPILLAHHGQVGTNKGEEIWGEATYEQLGASHHLIRLNAKILDEKQGEVIFLAILAHELTHIGLFSRGIVPAIDDECGKFKHELTAYEMQSQVERWKLGQTTPETHVIIMQMTERAMEACK